MMTNCEKKLRTIETKQDKLEQMITAYRLGTIKESAHSAGNFASLLYKEFMAHLFGQENIRNMYNWGVRNKC